MKKIALSAKDVPAKKARSFRKERFNLYGFNESASVGSFVYSVLIWTIMSS